MHSSTQCLKHSWIKTSIFYMYLALEAISAEICKIIFVEDKNVTRFLHDKDQANSLINSIGTSPYKDTF